MIFLLLALAGVPLVASAQSATCPTFPAADCRRPTKSKLALRSADQASKLVWQWSRGQATDVADFGDPTTTASYSLCLYAGPHSDTIVTTTIPGGAPWQATRSTGYRYEDGSGSAGGIRKISLKGGSDGKARITVRGKGATLPAVPLPASLPLRVQLVNSDTSACWEDMYDGTDIRKNDETGLKYKAVTDVPGAPLRVLRPAEPLPVLTAAEAGVPAFVGAAAIDQPIPPLVIPLHPILDNGGDSRIHNDGYNSAVYNRPGPRGINPDVRTTSLLGDGDFANVCAMLAFDDDGFVLGACIRANLPAVSAFTQLVMLDPVTLDVHADVTVAPRPLVQNSAGGAYFSIDQAGRLIIGPANNRVEIWERVVNGGQATFVRLASHDVSPSLPPDALLQDTVVDFDGRLWFAAITGQIGYFDPASERLELIDIGEELQNSFAVDGTGVYMVSFDAMYKFSVDVDGTVKQDWRTPYDNTGPGLLQPGSGTTPTLFGSLDDLVGFADTALPQVNMVVLDRTTGAQVCLTPIFRPDESGAENTFIGYEDEVVVVNNGGFPGTFGPQRDVFPGLEKYQVRPDRSGCDVVWVNDTSFGNSAQLSTTTGLIYGWGADPSVSDLDAYYVTAADWVTGAEVYRVYVGNDQAFNPVVGQPHLHPDGAAYVGTLSGVIRIADTP